MGCIYMRTDPNGKSYIGQTSFDEGKRWKEHCNIAYLKTNTGYDYPLSRAIRKYGPENFTCTMYHRILLQNLTQDGQLLLRD